MNNETTPQFIEGVSPEGLQLVARFLERHKAELDAGICHGTADFTARLNAHGSVARQRFPREA